MNRCASSSNVAALLALDARAESDVVAHRQPGKQRRLLEHHGAVGPRRPGRRTLDGHAPAGRLLEAGDDVEQGGFAAARRPEQRNEFTVADREIDAGQRRHRIAAGIDLLDAAHLDDVHRDSARQCSTRLEISSISRSDRNPSQPDRHHVGHHHVHAADVIGIPKHIAQARLHRDDLGHDHGGPGDAQPDAHAGENRWQCIGQHDAQHQIAFARAHHLRSADQVPADVARSVRRIDHDGIECAERDQEDRAGVADAEQRDGKGQPGGDRDRPQALDQGIDAACGKRAPADHQAHGDAHDAGPEETLHDAPGREQHCVEPGPGIGIEPEAAAAEGPNLPGREDH